MTTAFETELCSRCGGTGKHSFNGEHSRCYKCDGKNGGKAYTKRGAAAKAYYLAKFQVPAETIQIGDTVSHGMGRFKVVEIKTFESNVKINGVAKTIANVALIGAATSYQTTVGSLVRRYPTEAENEVAIADALAYQETLTKAGTPRKTKGK